MLIPKFNEPRLPKYDLKAGRQIFDKERDRMDGRVATISKDAENPIDVKLRQMTLSSINGSINLLSLINMNIVVMVGDINHLRLIKGKVKDLYLSTRDVRLKTRKNEDVIVSFDKVISLTEKEV